MTRGEERHLAAAASSALHSVLAGSPRQAHWLGVSPSALYLAVAGGPEVVAVLSHDAVRLPVGLVLASTRAELPLTRLAPAAGALSRSPCTVGCRQLRWTGPAWSVVITAVRQWAPACVAPGQVAPGMIRQLRALLAGSRIGLDLGLLAALRNQAADSAAASALLGHGPGLTPSGDDVLAGFLFGARTFGLAVPALEAAVASLARARTTTLSARLLWHAVRGECAPELATLAAAMQGRGAIQPAARGLLAVGHSSGPALGLGLLLAAERAADDQASALAWNCLHPAVGNSTHVGRAQAWAEPPSPRRVA
jgi:hypothetical protein